MGHNFEVFSVKFQEMFLAFKEIPPNHPDRSARFYEYMSFIGKYCRENRSQINDINNDILFLRKKIESELKFKR